MEIISNKKERQNLKTFYDEYRISIVTEIPECCVNIKVKYLNDDALKQFHNNNNHFACAFHFFLPANVILKIADGTKL